MHNLMKYELIHYVHHTMHIRQLNLILFEGIINYNLEVLKRNTIVQSMHVLATKFVLIYFDIKEKRKKKNAKEKTQNKKQTQKLKMISSPMGGIVMTNDGNSILLEIDVNHPAAKSMIELSTTQDEEVGDGMYFSYLSFFFCSRCTTVPVILAQ